MKPLEDLFQAAREEVIRIEERYPEDCPAKRAALEAILLDCYPPLLQSVQDRSVRIEDQRLDAARKGGQARAKRARRRSPVRGWIKEIEDRRQGMTREAAYAHIERREGLQPGTVRRAVFRERARKKHSSTAKT